MKLFISLDGYYDVANILHFLAAFILLIKIYVTRNCVGVSGKTQLLYAFVYTSRYLDVFTDGLQANTPGKVVYITLSYISVITIFLLFRKTYERKNDTCRIELLVSTCLLFAVLVNHYSDRLEIFWTFSIYLEAVAIIPQIWFVIKAQRIHKVVMVYVTLLLIYKTLYIIHWIHRFKKEGHYDPISVCSGVVQFFLYIHFFIVISNLNEQPVNQDQLEEVVPIDDEKKDKKALLNDEYYKSNISTIVLSPASLLNKSECHDENPNKTEAKNVADNIHISG